MAQSKSLEKRAFLFQLPSSRNELASQKTFAYAAAELDSSLKHDVRGSILQFWSSRTQASESHA